MKPAVLLCMVRGIDVIAEELLERADFDLIVLHDAVGGLLESRGIPHRLFDSYSSPELQKRALRQTEARATHVVKELYSDAMRSQWAHLDDACWRALREQVLRTLSADFSEEIRACDTLRRCVCSADLRLIIVPDDYTRDARTAIATGHRLGIPSLHLLHGYPYQTQNLHDVVEADAIAVFSEHGRSIYEAMGMPKDRIIVTGNPLWDMYTAPTRPGTREQICTDSGLDPERPIVEYALTAPHRFSAVSAAHPLHHLRTAEAVFEAFLTLSRRHPDWQFLFRPHPVLAKDAERFEEEAAEAGFSEFRIDTLPLACDCIWATDVLLCTHSNMGIEALLAGKPVINVTIDEIGGPVFREGIGPLYTEGDAVLTAKSPEEIVSHVEAALLDSATREKLLERRPATLKRFNDGNDGRAAERFCRLVLNMAANPSAWCRSTRRYPEFEPALARAVPEDARRILVVGQAACHVASAIAYVRPEAQIIQKEEFDASSSETAEAVVLTDPVSASVTAYATLRAAHSQLAEGGVLVAPFRYGAEAEAVWATLAGRWAPPRQSGEAALAVGEYCEKGIRMVLSRCEFEIDTHAPAGLSLGEATNIEGWVIGARPRRAEPSSLARGRRERKARADKHNAQGEELFTNGDYHGAASCFARAIDTWHGEAIYYSNLGATLHALGEVDHAWNQTRHALHLNPNHKTVRANMRLVAAARGCAEEAEEILSLYGKER